MAKAKTKEDISSRKKDSSPVSLESKEQISQEELKKRELWSDSVRHLQNQEFDDEDSAVFAVVDQVITSLGFEAEKEKQMRQFLFDVLQLDPEIMEDLRSSLKIKS